MPSEEAFHDWSRSSSSPFALTALHAALILLTAFSLNFVSALGDEVPSNHPLPVASLNRTKPVDFESEILPFLKESCLACHNQTKAKADLILETPQTILKGGESGPAIVPENPGESLIFKAAGHLEKPLMPPKDNKVNAPDLNPEQLALLKLWIQQGAHGEVRGQQTIAWRPLGENVRPILALAVTADGQFAACGRGNELFVYQLPTGRTIGPISDPEIRRLASGETNAAHLDLIESLDFSPDGELLASGSYREVKLWRRQPLLPSPLHADFTITPALASATSGGQSLALASESGQIEILTNNTRHQTIQTNQRLKLLRISEDGSHLATLSDNGILEVWSCKDGKSIARTKLGVESQALAWAGEKLAAAGPEHTIQLWSLPENGTNLVAASVLKGHKDSVTELESFNNGSELLSGSTDATVRLWKLDSGEQVRSFEQGAPITALAISPDGKSAAIGAKNKAIRIWNLSEGKIIHELKGDYRTRYSLTDSERALSYAKTLNSYRKDRLAAAEKERESQVERVGKAGAAKSAAEKALADKEKELKTASDNHAAAEKSLAEARDGLKALREKSETAEAVLLKAKAAAKDALQKVLDEKLKEHADGIRAEFDRILTNSLARLAAIGTNEPAAKNPDAAPAKTNSTSLAGNAFDKILDEVTSKSGAAALASKALAETKPEAEKKEKELDEKVKSAQKAFADLEKALRPLRLTNSASANELTFAIGAAQKALDGATDAQNALQLAEAELKRQETFLATAQANFTNSAQLSVSLAFSPDGSLLAAAEGDGQIGLWSAQTGSPLDNVKAAPSGVELRAGLVTFSKNNALTIFEQGKLQVVDAVPSWKLERTIGSPGGDSVFADRVNAVRFSPDGQLLATGGGEPSRSGELKLFRVKDGQLTQEFKNLHSDVVLSLAFTPDGRYLASGAADRFAKVTELATGKLVRALEGHTHHVLALSWKRDGHTLMTGGADNIIKVWDVFSGEKKKNIEGFNKEVTSVSFIADTDQALACSGDNTVRLVKENGEKIKSFEGGADFLEAALPTPDGKLILAGGQDGVLRIWENESGKLIASYSGR